MYYLGINLCPRRHCRTWLGWAWFHLNHPTPTYFCDIKAHRFLRILGIEISLMWWEPKSRRTYRDPKLTYYKRTPEGKWIVDQEGKSVVDQDWAPTSGLIAARKGYPTTFAARQNTIKEMILNASNNPIIMEMLEPKKISEPYKF